MDSLFKRPEKPGKPEELTSMEIMQKMEFGQPIYCGRCKKQTMESLLSFRYCECMDGEETDSDSVMALRIENDKIIMDTFNVSDEEFDPKNHSPNVGNKKRTEIFREYING